MSKNEYRVGERAIYDARELGTGKMVVLGLQHMFAMFGATVVVPLITGLNVSTTLLFAGLGTLLFHLISKKKVPAFLGSSFAFLGGYAAIAPLNADGSPSELLPYACFGVACAGLLYLILAALFKAYGTSKVMKYFPPVVTGPIIISIGLNLAPSAINNIESCWWVALVAIIIVVICNIWGKGMIKIVPILLGVIGSYLCAAVAGLIDFNQVAAAPWIGIPISYKNTVFSIFTGGNLNAGLLLTSIVTIMPIALATMMEHIGDISAISSTCGMNTGVLTLTKVYDPRVIRIAAGFAILMSFCPKFAAIIEVMPAATIGGISLVLYGMISAVGVRNLVETNTDFSKSRNVLIAALIMVLSIGISYSNAGAINIPVGSMTLSLSGLATGSLVGIILNAILPGKDYKFEDDKPNRTGVNFEIISGETIVESREKEKK